MAGCPDIKTPFFPDLRDPQDAFRDARGIIARDGGELIGDVFAGRFSVPAGIGAVEGAYALYHNRYVIKVVKKPWYVSCRRIERAVLGWFAGRWLE